jgi:hypothetical protein
MHQTKEVQISKSEENDTLEVFRILFDSTLVGHLEENSDLFRNNPFGDSIIVLFDSLFLKTSPCHDSLKFKILSETEICNLATKCSDQDKLCPEFLNLRLFQKTSAGYEIDLRITCVGSNYRNGKRFINPITGELSDSCKCHFGYMCGRSIQMTFEKTKERLSVSKVGITIDR